MSIGDGQERRVWLKPGEQLLLRQRMSHFPSDVFTHGVQIFRVIERSQDYKDVCSLIFGYYQ